MPAAATTLFISDLHLDEKRPEITGLFLNFLHQQAQAQASRCEALYILGDLFEAWIGDDDDSELAAAVASGLRQLAECGTAVYFIHGNRDFLLGERYAEACRMSLLAESEVIDLYGQPTLIMHGDTLCSDDVDYQQFRVQTRSPEWQQQMLALPLAQRRQLAGQMRAESQHAMAQKADDIMDVNPQTVSQTMAEHRVQRLIHGHTHRPAIHPLTVDGRAAQRIVLGDWYDHGSVLSVTAEDCQLQGLTL